MPLRKLLFFAWLSCALPAGATVVPVFEGIDDGLARRVLERHPADIRCDNPRWVVRAWVRDLEAEIRRVLRARSHYSPEIEVVLVREDDCWRVQLTTDPGAETLLRSLDVRLDGDGQFDGAFAALIGQQNLRENRPFREQGYEALKRGLRRVALERGYFDSRFEEARVDIWPDEQAADVVLVFATGQRYRFGAMTIEVTPPMLGDSVLDRFRLWQPGQPYTTQEVERLRRRILQAGYFDSVEVMPRAEARADGLIDVDVSLGLRPRHEVSGGFGFATDFGPRVGTAYENRYLNQRGHQGTVRANLSPVLQKLQGEYRMPLRGGNDSWLLFDASLHREDTDSTESFTQALAVRRVYSGPWSTRITESLNLQREDFDVASDDAVAILLMPALAISKQHQTRTRPLEIGWRLDGQVRGAAEPLATANFLQVYGQGSMALPIGERARILGRVELGATLAGSLASLPASIRFFAGGDRSIRGYSLNALGPTDPLEEVRGGRHLAVTSLELERAVKGNWSVALFADYGGAFNNTSDPATLGVGVGVRWLSPIGPIRVDLASPLDDPDRSFRLHIGVGSTFQ